MTIFNPDFATIVGLVVTPAIVIILITDQATHVAVANMTLLINDVELSIPQGTPAAYLAELIEWLNENSSCFIDLSFNLRLTSTIE
ncbi:hypothetical protein [Vibrio fluvialis]|uniref:hypothetical protein n=1 Tax=Vibrio fluvialis TaxID=676 RepID=UPI001F3133DB|nr:hypothetical protein [Vibrio fluvialis]MCE7595937.1 hypothetical protein [Vibrio fluvialis]